MEIAGLILAMPGLIDLFWKTGILVHDKIQGNKRLKDEARDIRVFLIEDGRAQLDRDFQLVMLILKDAGTPNEEKRRVHRVLEKSLEQLQQVAQQAESMPSLEFWKRPSALKAMHEIFKDVKTSMREFHQLVMSLHTTVTSEAPLLLEDQDFALTGDEKERQILNDVIFVSNGRVSQLFPYGGEKNGRFLVERRSYERYSAKSTKKDVRLLSQKLSAVQQGNGILPLVGFRDEPSKDEFQLVFGIPFPRTKLDTLQSTYKEQMPSLNFRVYLCQQLAEAVLQTHKLGMVHKHIRPENVLVLTGEGKPLPEIFLLGWQYARLDGSVTRMGGEVVWERAIYQHPERQAEHAEVEYCMGHDIYSLGVCMLEILLWDPIVAAPGQCGTTQGHISQAYKALFDQYERQTAANQIEDSDDEEFWTGDPQTVRRVLLRLIESRIPGAAGERLKYLLSQCLTCLSGEDELESLFGVVGRNSKHAAVGFVDTVLKDIREVMNAL